MKLAGRLALTATVSVVVTTAVVVTAAVKLLREALEERLAQELQREASLLAAIVGSRPQAPNELAHHYGRLLGHRVTLVALDGRVMGDSDFDDAALALLENHRNRPEVREALASGLGRAKRYSESTGRVELKVAVRSPQLVVRLSAPVSEVEQLENSVQRSLLLAALAVLVVSLIGARAIARPVSSALQRIAETARTPEPHPPLTAAAYPFPELAELATAVETLKAESRAAAADLRRESDAWRAAIDSVPLGVIVSDPAGNVRIANSAARKLLGYSEVQALPAVAELFRQRELREIVHHLQQGGESVQAEVSLGERTIALYGRTLTPGGAVLFLQDLTELRRLETARRDFLANLSHELKTPLTNIAGYAETLLGETGPQAPHRQFLEVILDHTRRMRRLVEDVLELSRIETQGLHLSPEAVNLAEAVEEVFATFRERAQRQGVNLELQCPKECRLRADPEALRRILENLLDNSLRHTPTGGRISVLARETDQAVEVGVSDTGSGIPREHLDRVFERFYRVDVGRSRAEGGTGLGLAIVKHLMEAHGGSARIESEIGQGTTVWLRFPRGA